MSLYRHYRLTPTISSLGELALWREWAANLGEAQPVHLKVDTGMSRLGVALDEMPEALAARPTLLSVTNVNSPRRVDAELIENVMVLARHGQCVVITPFTLMGAMAPVTLAGAGR